MIWIAIGGYVTGVLGVAVALGAQLRIASLEQELALYQWLYQEAVQGGQRGPLRQTTRREADH